MKKAINLAYITTEGLLLVRKKDVWILPGGKPEKEESDYDCLLRELNEELLIHKDSVSIYRYYGEFIDQTPSSKSQLEAKVYFGSIKGRLNPSAEIDEAKHIKDLENYNISEITKKIINSLKKDKYL